MNKRILNLITACCLWAMLVPTAALHADTNLSFGVYTSDKPTEMIKQFRPLLDSLEAKLTARLGDPVKIAIRVAPSYDEGIRRLVQGEVDISQFGPAPYVIAKDQNADIEILALESEKGKKEFDGFIAIHAESTIESISDLKGKSFAFGDHHSTIGRYLSQQLLMQNGIFSRDLSHYDYLERHDAVGAAIGAKQFDAGALKAGAFKKLVEKGAPIKVLAKFSNITKPWVARAGLDRKVKLAITEELLAFKETDALAALGQDGFLVGDDRDFDSTRSSVRENKKFEEK